MYFIPLEILNQIAYNWPKSYFSGLQNLGPRASKFES